jgi:hypothetical protein
MPAPFKLVDSDIKRPNAGKRHTCQHIERTVAGADFRAAWSRVARRTLVAELASPAFLTGAAVSTGEGIAHAKR